MKLWKSAILATFVAASVVCFVLAFAGPGQAAGRNLSQMEMARLFGGSNYDDVCCEDDFMCFDTVPYSTPCVYRELYNCDTWDQPNYYDVLVGVQGRYCSRPSNYTPVICSLDDNTHICLERRFCYQDWTYLACLQDATMQFPTPNSCLDDSDLCYF